MRRVIRFDYVRLCRRCDKYYRGAKFSSICPNCNQNHASRAGWHRDKKLEAFWEKIKLRDLP